jgi:divalent metal cation (Fe/Co/Zn/Cd) transporter
LKSLNLDCVLKVSKRQRDELQYKHALLESIFEQLMKTLYIYSCRLAFAEMCVLLFERVCCTSTGNIFATNIFSYVISLKIVRCTMRVAMRNR